MTFTAYIYLIQDGGYVNTNVYKVGRTTQNGDTRRLNRLKCYSTNTIQIYVREVNTEKVVEIEKDIIIKHMWPLTITPPRYYESYIVTFVDKYVSSIEFINEYKKKALSTKFPKRRRKTEDSNPTPSQ